MAMISQKHYVDTRFSDLQDQIDRRITNLMRELTSSIVTQKESVAKSEDAINNRLAGMNEFREALAHQQSTFLTLDRYDETLERYDERHGELSKRISAMELWQSNVMGRAIAISFIGAFILAGVTALLYHVL